MKSALEWRKEGTDTWQIGFIILGKTLYKKVNEDIVVVCMSGKWHHMFKNS